MSISFLAIVVSQSFIVTDTLANLTVVSAVWACIKQVAQLSQRDRTAKWVSFCQKWKTGMGIRYSADIIGLQPL